MGIKYGTKFLTCDTIMHVRYRKLPDFTTKAVYISDMMIHLFHIFTHLESTRRLTLTGLYEAIERYIHKLYPKFGTVVLCFDISAFTVQCKSPEQQKRRQNREPMTNDEYDAMTSRGTLVDWQKIRATSGARDWIVTHLIEYLANNHVPAPDCALFLHGNSEYPDKAYVIVCDEKGEVEGSTFNIPIIAEGDLQVVYWANMFIDTHPVVPVVNDKDVIGILLLNAHLHRSATGWMNNLLMFRSNKLLSTYLNQRAWTRKIKRNSKGVIPTYEAPFLDIHGLNDHINNLLAQKFIETQSPVESFLFMLVVAGCDFIDPRWLPRISGDKLLDMWLDMGPRAPVFIDFRDEHLFLYEEKFSKFICKKICAKRKVAPTEQEARAAARRAAWVMLYWRNGVNGLDAIPDDMAVDQHNKSIWGWAFTKCGKVTETTDISPTIPDDYPCTVADAPSSQMQFDDKPVWSTNVLQTFSIN